MSAERRKVILGLGNILNRDEGVGVHCLGPLRARLPSSAGFEVLDGGVLGMALLPIVEDSSHLLLLDAVDAGRPPGTVIELEGTEIPEFFQIKMSWHQLTFQEVLQLAKVRGKLPPALCLVGIQPADISTGTELSEAVRKAVPTAVEFALGILERWRRGQGEIERHG